MEVVDLATVVGVVVQGLGIARAVVLDSVGVQVQIATVVAQVQIATVVAAVAVPILMGVVVVGVEVVTETTVVLAEEIVAQ